MSILKIILFFVVSCSSAFAANIYVDGGSIESGATWTGTNGASYTCGHGVGTGYSTVQAAVTAMNGGDDIYVRGGTYYEYATLSSSKNGSPSDWSSIQSYPGEWAIIDAQQAEHYCLGSNNYDKTRTSSMLEYWKFERLELTGGDDSGLFLTGGPFLIRYCYFHDNIAPDGDANPCAIKGMIWKDSIVEYCYFKNNGSDGSADEMHSAIGIQIHSDYEYSDPTVGPVDITDAYQNNIYRYNLFENTESTAMSGIHDKALQTLSPNTEIDWTYEEYGNDIHHNIFLGIDSPIGAQQCFAQIHNNIAWDAEDGIQNADSGNGRGAMAQVVYNNTIYAGRIIGNFCSAQYSGWKSPYFYVYNNILDSAPPDSDWRYDIRMGTWSIDTTCMDISRKDINNNYIYRPSNSTDIKFGTDDAMSIESFDSLYGFSNYSQASTEGTISLYQGAGDSDQYTTNGNHLISGSTSIGNGGIGGNHPYLDGVSMPTYIGATNPDDNGWVDGVMSLSPTTFAAQTSSADPTWIEGAEAIGITIRGDYY